MPETTAPRAAAASPEEATVHRSGGGERPTTRRPRPGKEPTDGQRLDESHQHLEQRGFSEATFGVAPGGKVVCSACGTKSAAARMAVDTQKRVEGVSDPDDQSLVVATTCPKCQARGTLTLAYGPRAGRDEAQVLADLPAPRKKAS